ncbi:MAG: hypothetical protein IK008_04950 [Bacteroidales bacterium]|nr:hypothetical protein [Bacteroidales bacterium]
MKTLKWIIATVTVLLVAVSCEALKNKKKQVILFDVYHHVTNIAQKYSVSKEGHATVGNKSGDADFSFTPSSIRVNYSVGRQSASETGEISELKIVNDCGLADESGFYPISLQGRWQPEGSGGGNLVISVGNKTLHFHIFGDGDWQYDVIYSLPSNGNLVEQLVEAKKKLNGIDKKNEDIPAEDFRGFPDEKPKIKEEEPAHAKKGAILRDDIVPPKQPSLESVSFPAPSTFISSGDNFKVKGAKNTYFAYVPEEHWGVLIMQYDNNSWARRYVYCTGWDSGRKTLRFATYDQKSGKYIGILEGTFKTVDGKYHYTAEFINYKGAHSATFYMVED